MDGRTDVCMCVCVCVCLDGRMDGRRDRRIAAVVALGGVAQLLRLNQTGLPCFASPTTIAASNRSHPFLLVRFGSVPPTLWLSVVSSVDGHLRFVF